MDNLNPALVADLSDRILAYCKTKPAVSFAELSRDVEGFKGGYCWEFGRTNIIFWSGLSLEAGTAISKLFRSGRIDLDPCHPLTYLIDGHARNLPLATEAKSYDTEHWLPVVLNLKGGAA